MKGKVYVNGGFIKRWIVVKSNETDLKPYYNLFDRSTYIGTFAYLNQVIKKICELDDTVSDLIQKVEVIFPDEIKTKMETTSVTQFFRAEKLETIGQVVKHNNGTIINQGQDVDGYWCVYSLPSPTFGGTTKIKIEFEIDFSKLPDQYQYISFDAFNGELVYHENEPTIVKEGWVQHATVGKTLNILTIVKKLLEHLKFGKEDKMVSVKHIETLLDIGENGSPYYITRYEDSERITYYELNETNYNYYKSEQTWKILKNGNWIETTKPEVEYKYQQIKDRL